MIYKKKKIKRRDHIDKMTVSARRWPQKWGFFDSKAENVIYLF